MLLLTSATLIRCSKTSDVIEVKPRLLITLKDEVGNFVSGANVRLYKNLADTGIIKISDSTGVVIFTDLDAELYYWEAKKGCLTNRISQTTVGRLLIPNVILYGYSLMSETGELIITNNSLESYAVADSTFSAIIKRDSTYTAFKRVGSYLLHSIPISDSTLIRDTLIQINCGDTFRLNLPY